ncbi:MAG: methylaspartate mutase accessory protein GlmL [Eubacteriaceae bacterium]
MKPVLLADFGSTYTKLTAVDLESHTLISTAASFTTVETDIYIGFENALNKLKIGLKEELVFNEVYVCSSAAGGLKIVALGLVPELTVQAAKEASLGAGGKILKSYAYEIVKSDLEEIKALDPDIILLTGGTDGGNRECIIHNAEMLTALDNKIPIIVAGNRSCADVCKELLRDKEVYFCENVMPKFGKLNILPTQELIRKIFLNKIVYGKGLGKIKSLASSDIMPTPAAMLEAMKLLGDGIGNNPGIGELVGIDLGGATTDVYSIAKGSPSQVKTVYKGLEEPYAKRSVEGDIGMRYSIRGIVEVAGIKRIAEVAGGSEEKTEEGICFLEAHKNYTPDCDLYQNLDKALASLAVEIAVKRHAGKIEEVYTPVGETYLQTGKDLRGVTNVIGTGGALIHSKDPTEIVKHGFYDPKDPESLRPTHGEIWIDKKYILAAMGLLSLKYPEAALEIMKREIVNSGNQK